MNTTSRGSSQGKNSAGQKHGSVHSEEKHGTRPGRANHVNKPFPNKPVYHKRPHNPTSRDSLEHNNLEKVSISKKSSAPSHSHEYMSNSIRRETTGSGQPDKEYLKQIHGEMQMARAIHAKQLVLHEKLWKVEEKIRLKFQLESAAAAAAAGGGDGQKSEQEGKDYRGRGETETRQRKEAEKRSVEAGKRTREDQDQRKEDRMIKKCEEQEDKWDRGEIKYGDYLYSEIKGNKGTREGTVHEEDTRKELKGGKETEKDNRVWERTNVRSKHGKAEDREQNRTSKVDETLLREKNYSAHNDDMNEGPQMSQQKSARGPVPENHRVAERKVTEEPSASQVSSPSQSGRHREQESEVADSTLVPCRICNRNFTIQRVEKHVKICEKAKQLHRPVFNSYNNRTKGSVLEEYLKTHSRSKTPEVLLKKTKRQNMKKQHQGQPPARASKPKWSK